MKTIACALIVLAASAAMRSPSNLRLGSNSAQQNPQFDLLIKNGRVIDPANGVDAVMDVAVTGAKIARVAANIDPAQARRVVDATGLHVVPGLIDIHSHVFFGTEKDAYLSNADTAVQPDSHSFRSGQTTLVDVGGAGWRNFCQFKEQVIDRARTRVLSFINIVGSGMKGGPVEQNLADMDAKLTAMRIRQHPGVIVGIKVAHYTGPEWDPVTRAVAAGRETNVPVMVDFGGHTPPLSLEDLLLKHLQARRHPDPHLRARRWQDSDRGRGRKSPPVCLGGAQARGHLRCRPWRRQLSLPAGRARAEAGISSRRHQHRPAHRQHEQRHEGHPEHDVEVPEHGHDAPGRHQGQYRRRPREVIKRPDLGRLSVGAEADIAVLNLRRGTFGFIDVVRRQAGRRSEAGMRADGQGRAGGLGSERHLAADVDRDAGAGRQKVTGEVVVRPTNT